MAQKFGLQLYSVRDEMDRNYMGTLDRIAGLGYSGVEFAGFQDFSAKDILERLKFNRLDPMSAHVGVDSFEGDQLLYQLEFLSELGCNYMICPWYDIKTIDDVHRIAEILNNASVAAKKYGVFCGYHNHGQEFTAFEGEFAYTHLMRNTNPEIVMELDVFWVAHSDVNPFDYFKLHTDRIKILHLKQITADKKSCNLPDGIIDMPELIRVAKKSGVGKFIVEQEEYAVSSMESARINAEYLKELL